MQRFADWWEGCDFITLSMWEDCGTLPLDPKTAQRSRSWRLDAKTAQRSHSWCSLRMSADFIFVPMRWARRFWDKPTLLSAGRWQDCGMSKKSLRGLNFLYIFLWEEWALNSMIPYDTDFPVMNTDMTRIYIKRYERDHCITTWEGSDGISPKFIALLCPDPKILWEPCEIYCAMKRFGRSRIF